MGCLRWQMEFSRGIFPFKGPSVGITAWCVHHPGSQAPSLLHSDVLLWHLLRPEPPCTHWGSQRLCVQAVIQQLGYEMLNNPWERCRMLFAALGDSQCVGWGSVPQEISWGHLPVRKEHNCRQVKMVCWDPNEGPLDQCVVEQIFKWVTPRRYVCQFLCKWN